MSGVKVKVRCEFDRETETVHVVLGDLATMPLTPAMAEVLAMELRLCVAALADPEFVMPSPVRSNKEEGR